MSYLLLIVEPVGQRAERTPDEGRDAYDTMLRFGEDLKARGLLVAAQSLASTDEAVRVEIRGGERRLIDGPFAEAKEMVGGFYLLNCDREEEALAIAAECPAAQWCTVEVRRLAPCSE
ncbi:YciI family protein [Trinickia dinghuensis]|uniref:Dehydrogenase n=1 Tax=Trinickia dinghuensis TaxID=2291023 RepID=A0A3D8K424_9BURK|nr:YciI family protein [Trinickia dinghuensis]RDV00184.1 dehydrogenase [Trinickia dinghuensis]